MAVIVEDGSGVDGANSYVDAADARAYALDRGVTLDADDTKLEGQIVLAADYIESFGPQFVGTPVLYTQAMSWPRNGVQFDPNNPFPNDEIPIALIRAQNEAIISVSQGVILQPTVDPSDGGFVTLEKVGPIETKFSEKVGTTVTPFLPKVFAQLATLLNGSGGALRTIRV